SLNYLHDEDWFNLFFQSIIFSRFSCRESFLFSALNQYSNLFFSCQGGWKIFFWQGKIIAEIFVKIGIQPIF
ncbi:MAG: hypothetical protein LW859_15600, partial [Anabaena sp. 49633_E8]|nr:hypothetical protein [Anabaena sp. 49633_E8]